MGLDFDGVGEVEGSSHEVADGNVLAVLDVAGEDGGLEPVEAPGVFDGDDGVGARDYAPQDEGSVEVALIATEEIDVRDGVARHQGNHDARDFFVLFLYDTFDTDDARGNRGRHLSGCSSGNGDVMTP